VHGEFQGREARAEIVLRNGKIAKIIFGGGAGKPLLEGQKLRLFKELVRVKGDEIVERWINYFVKKARHKPEIITKKLK
jgi:hypothetical protein